jgi:hypothetical protein
MKTTVLACYAINREQALLNAQRFIAHEDSSWLQSELEPDPMDEVIVSVLGYTNERFEERMYGLYGDDKEKMRGRAVQEFLNTYGSFAELETSLLVIPNSKQGD